MENSWRESKLFQLMQEEFKKTMAKETQNEVEDMGRIIAPTSYAELEAGVPMKDTAYEYWKAGQEMRRELGIR